MMIRMEPLIIATSNIANGMGFGLLVMVYVGTLTSRHYARRIFWSRAHTWSLVDWHGMRPQNKVGAVYGARGAGYTTVKGNFAGWTELLGHDRAMSMESLFDEIDPTSPEHEALKGLLERIKSF